MDTEMRLHYIERERSAEAARMLRIADARALSPARRQAPTIRLDALSRIAANLRTGGRVRRDAAGTPKRSTDVRRSF